MKRFEGFFGKREKALVPRVTGPPRQMPVHVEDHDVDRQAHGRECVREGENLPVGVGPITRIPIAENIARRQWLGAENSRRLPQRSLVIVAAANEIPVQRSIFAPRGRPREAGVAIRVEERIARIVVKRPSVAGQQSVLDRHLADLHPVPIRVEIHLHVASGLIQGPHGAFEVAGVFLAGAPIALRAVPGEPDAEIFAMKGLSVLLVADVEKVGPERQGTFSFFDRKRHFRRVAVDGRERGPIFKGSRRRPFHA